MRRGFTILELSLAAAIGGLIVLASLGVFTALDRTDQTLKARFDQTSQLTRLHAVMRRTFVNLAMSPKPRPTTRVQSNTTPTAAARNAPGSATDPQAASNPPAEQPQPEHAAPEPARVILAEDRRVSMTPMLRLPMPGQGAGPPLSWRPQRLEVVVGRPPVPLPRARDAAVFPEGNAGHGEIADGEELLGTKLFRGMFELVPVPKGSAGPGGAPPRNVLTWSLWWRPMPPGSPAEQGPEGSIREHDLLPPTLIASDLVFLRWQFYDNRERKAEFSTAYLNDLPAYVEMEVQTVAGLWANWLFEVDFIMSSEEPAGDSGAGGGGQGVRSFRPVSLRGDGTGRGGSAR